MLTVMMGVLAFFIVTTATLGDEGSIDMDLPAPQSEEPSPPETPGDPFLVEIDANGDLMLNRISCFRQVLTVPDPSITFQLLTQHIRTYFAENPEGKLILKADKTLPYQDISVFLKDLRDIGANQVSLAVE